MASFPASLSKEKAVAEFVAWQEARDHCISFQLKLGSELITRSQALTPDEFGQPRTDDLPVIKSGMPASIARGAIMSEPTGLSLSPLSVRPQLTLLLLQLSGHAW